MTSLQQSGIQGVAFAEMTARSRKTDPITSLEAAETVDVGKGQLLVLKAFYHAHVTGFEPLTEDGLNRLIFNELGLTGLQHDSPRKRRAELEEMRYVEVADSDGVSSTGRRMRRYWITSRGIDLLTEISDADK